MTRALLILFCAVLASCAPTEATAMATHTPMTGAISIIPVGDSTTVGTLSSGNPPDVDKQSYRLALGNAIVADLGSGAIPGTCSFTWEGPFSYGSAPSQGNFGVSGATTESSFAQMPSVIPSTTPGTQSIVILQLGVNDTQHDIALFPNGYLSAVRRMHNLLRSTNPRFIFGLLEGSWAPSQVAPFNLVLPVLWDELRREGIEFETMSWDWIPGLVNAHLTQPQYDAIGANDVPGQCYHVAFRSLIGYPM